MHASLDVVLFLLLSSKVRRERRESHKFSLNAVGLLLLLWLARYCWEPYPSGEETLTQGEAVAAGHRFVDTSRGRSRELLHLRDRFYTSEDIQAPLTATPFSGDVWSLSSWDALGVQETWPECVDTTRECVDTLSHLRKKIFWEMGLVSTLPLTGSSVDTTRDCVDTLDPVFMKLLQGMIPSVDTINGCVDTTMIRIVCP
ncbi:hypothetical protein Taro_051951 [Colocasia esculenta]|uniref:Uncharacterized protein n=1 Tax=Colocasia esculenta TaxID=4460 RepID=A0A843XIB7_COLES|nr:hypothetical protein [Colocasia esculenta]